MTLPESAGRGEGFSGFLPSVLTAQATSWPIASVPIAPSPSFSQKLPLRQIAQVYSARQRIHVPDVLDARYAAALYEHLEARRDWMEVINEGERVHDFAPGHWEALSPAEKKRIEALVINGGQSGFQFRYHSIRTSDDRNVRRQHGTLLDEFAEFLCSEDALAIFRAATGFDDIVFADAQATRYSHGHFLTCHDDNVRDKNRRAAFVFNLTANWRAEWGGLLMFHAPDGHIDEAMVPCWNAINIFSVPQPHSVSWVCNLAPTPRYAITGWLRSVSP